MYYGYGRVNAAKAVAAALATTGGNTQDTQAPSTPTNLTASNVTSSSATLTWSPSTDNVGVSGYDVYRNGSKLTTVAGTQYTDSGLMSKTSYTYAIAARDAAGNVSGQSASAFVTTPDTPFSVSSYSIGSKTTTSATVNVTLTKPGTVVVKYGKSTTDLSLTGQSSTSGTTHSVPLTGLTSKTTYYYQITATDAGGTTVTSPISSFKTAAGGGKNR
jgi:chitodextrinase